MRQQYVKAGLSEFETMKCHAAYIRGMKDQFTVTSGIMQSYGKIINPKETEWVH